MVLIRFTILFLLVSLWGSISSFADYVNSGHAPLSITDGTTTCYPYQLGVPSGSLSCASGIATLDSGAQYWSLTGNNLYPTTIGNNVGIGTITPTQILDVNGTIGIQSQQDWVNNDIDVLEIGQDINCNDTCFPLRLIWSNPNNNNWLSFEDDGGDTMNLHANFYGDYFQGPASGLTFVPGNQFGTDIELPSIRNIVFDYFNAPTNTITVATSTTGGTLAAGTYRYYVTCGRANGNQTDFGTAVSQITTGSTSKNTLSNIPICSDPLTTFRDIYRSFNGTFQIGFLKNIANNSTTTFVDDGSITVTARSLDRSTGLGNTMGGNIKNDQGSNVISISREGRMDFKGSRSGILLPAITDGGDTTTQFRMKNCNDDYNYEYGFAQMVSNTFNLGVGTRGGGCGGLGGALPITISSSDTNGTTLALKFSRGGANWFDFSDAGTSQSNFTYFNVSHSWSANGGLNILGGFSYTQAQSGSASGIGFRINDTVSSLGSGVNDIFEIQRDSVNKLLVNVNGNVGIGSDRPGSLLDVQGTIRMTGFNFASGAGTGKVWTSDSSGNGSWGTASAGTVTAIIAGTGLTGGTITTSGTINSNAVEHLSYQPGLLTAINSTIGVYYKASKASTVDNIIGSAVTFSCIANPTITMYECGTSVTCASTPTTIGTVTVTAAGTATVGTVSNSAITAGDYVGWAMTAGTCASIDISATAQIHSN